MNVLTISGFEERVAEFPRDFGDGYIHGGKEKASSQPLEQLSLLYRTPK